MHLKIILAAAVLAIGCTTPAAVMAAEAGTGVVRQDLQDQPLDNAPGHALEAITFELEPGVTIPAHKHGGTVFVYVLEGTVRSQLNDDPAKDYATGESWVEPFGATHTLTQNTSDTDKAKILTVFVLDDGSALTTFEKPAD